MPRHQGALVIDITPELWETAKQAKSGGCLIADAVAAKYPHLARVRADAATIRATDTRTSERLTWISPQAAGMLLLHFDQGWSQPANHTIRTRKPAHVAPIIANGPVRQAQRAQKRTERLAELEAKDPATLTSSERQSIQRLRKPMTPPARPSSRGRSRVVVNRDGSATKVGGDPPATIAKGKHPNLLAGTDRHYGQRLADPGQVWNEALELEIERRREAGTL